jgi:transposase InsO family protein
VKPRQNKEELRAMHILDDTSTLIMALRRMATRRGWPQKLYSDNGTNLRGTESELKRSFAEINKSDFEHELTYFGVEWSFITPASPHMGATWERLIRTVKTALCVR